MKIFLSLYWLTRHPKKPNHVNYGWKHVQPSSDQYIFTRPWSQTMLVMVGLSLTLVSLLLTWSLLPVVHALMHKIHTRDRILLIKIFVSCSFVKLTPKSIHVYKTMNYSPEVIVRLLALCVVLRSQCECLITWLIVIMVFIGSIVRLLTVEEHPIYPVI